MDKMRIYELELIIDSLNLTVKNDWLLTRQLFYVIALTNSEKPLKPEKIMPLPYDDHSSERLSKKQAIGLKKLMEYENTHRKALTE